jgi:hypothetical protein
MFVPLDEESRLEPTATASTDGSEQPFPPCPRAAVRRLAASDSDEEAWTALRTTSPRERRDGTTPASGRGTLAGPASEHSAVAVGGQSAWASPSPQVQLQLPSHAATPVSAVAALQNVVDVASTALHWVQVRPTQHARIAESQSGESKPNPRLRKPPARKKKTKGGTKIGS